MVNKIETIETVLDKFPSDVISGIVHVNPTAAQHVTNDFFFLFIRVNLPPFILRGQ